MTAEHNHPPRCCCGVPPIGPDDQTATPCPGCPEHGDLASPAECPSCHQAPGRPPTEYCLDQAWHGVIAVPRQTGKTTMATAGQTTVAGVGEIVGPDTHIRDGVLKHHRSECHPLVCGRLPRIAGNLPTRPIPGRLITRPESGDTPPHTPTPPHNPGECTYPGCTTPRPTPNQ